MSLRRELERAAAVAAKDLLAERRSRAHFGSVVAFAGLVLLLFGFALGPDAQALRAAAAGILWLTVLFTGVLAFQRSWQIELESGALDALLLYPGDRRALFVGKLTANLALVLLVEAAVVALATAFYGLALAPALPGLLLVLALGTLGFVALGTFYAAMASRLRAREALLPLLLFPMLVPLLLASVEATRALLAGDVMGEAKTWLGLLAAFDVVFVTASLLTFEHVIEE